MNFWLAWIFFRRRARFIFSTASRLKFGYSQVYPQGFLVPCILYTCVCCSLHEFLHHLLLRIFKGSVVRAILAFLTPRTHHCYHSLISISPFYMFVFFNKHDDDDDGDNFKSTGTATKRSQVQLWPFHCKLFMPMFVSYQALYILVLAKRPWCSAAGKVITGLAENNGSLLLGFWLSDLHCLETNYQLQPIHLHLTLLSVYSKVV